MYDFILIWYETIPYMYKIIRCHSFPYCIMATKILFEIVRILNNPFLGADTSISILIKFIESISKHFSLFFCDALNDGLKSKVIEMLQYYKYLLEVFLWLTLLSSEEMAFTVDL